jgi:hypothetical protein
MFCVFVGCLPGITGYHRVSPGITGYHRVSPGITGYHRVSPGITGYHRVSLNPVILCGPAALLKRGRGGVPRLAAPPGPRLAIANSGNDF